MSTLAQEAKPVSATNKEAVSPNSNFMGAAGQTAIAIGTSLSNFYKFLRQYALQKAAETKNTLSAAQSQASSIIAAGKNQLLGSIMVGAGEIAAGVAGLGAAGYNGYQTAKTNAEFNKLNEKAPQLLQGFRDEAKVAPGNLDEGDFNRILRDPRVLETDPDLHARVSGKDFAGDQEARLNTTLQQFRNGKAPLQKELKANLQELKTNTASAEQAFQYLTKGLGNLGQGVYSAKAATDNAAATMAEAARSMASGAIETTGQFISQLERLIEALYQTQGALANVNR